MVVKKGSPAVVDLVVNLATLMVAKMAALLADWRVV